MTTLKVTAKGQVTLRKDVLHHLGVHPGEQIVLDKRPDGRIEVRAARSGHGISQMFDLLKIDGSRSLSIDEINQIAAEGWSGRR